MISRYDACGSEAEFEPGSNGRVLKNRLGIRSIEAMEDAEAVALEKVSVALVNEVDAGHRFTAADICRFHKDWLGDIYDWAGDYRQLNVSKGGFMFAAAAQIPTLMRKLEQNELAELSPCNFQQRDKVVNALAVTHVELVLIHPFREGNGRVARLLSTLMALQAGLPLLDFSSITGEQREIYFAAIQAGVDEDYRPMEKLLAEIIERSLASF